MKSPYYVSLLALPVLLLWSEQGAAQGFTICPTEQDVCVVQWATPQGEPIINALRNTIANDTDRPPGRVYVLLRGGFYYNEDHISNTDWHLRLRGQTAEEGAATGQNVCGPEGNEDCGPAILQRVRRADGTVDPRMIESSGSGNSGLTLENLWIMGQDNTGVTSAYEPITINSSDSDFLFDNVVFDRNDWHHLGFKRGGNRIHIRNSVFRNLTGQTQIWEGRAIRLEAGAAEVLFENNTFFNLTSFPFQSEAAPVDYFLFNHNTLINFGRNFNAGGLWQQAFITNNIMVNPFWQGESQAQYQSRRQSWIDAGNDPNRFPEHIGVFSIAALPSQYGLEVDRRIVLANNNWYRTSEVDALHAPHGIRGQPLVNDTTAAYFARYDGMVMQGNLNVNPGFANAPLTTEVYGQMGEFITQWVTSAPSPWTIVYWDPGRPPIGDPRHPVTAPWPRPENLTYTNPALLTAGTDGLPLGDLNWFPDAKATYLANREQFIAAIEALAGAPPETPVANLLLEAEDGIDLDNAEVRTVDGFTYFQMDGTGWIQWDFELQERRQYDINIWTHMRGNAMRGQRVIVNGVSIRDERNWGEYIWDTASGPHAGMPINEWTWTRIRQAELHASFAGALTLPAGRNTVRIEASWGWQNFAGIQIINPDNDSVVLQLLAPDATYSGVRPRCAEAPHCPSGFQWINFGPNGRLTWSVDVPDNTNSGLLRLFYRAPVGSSGSILVNGQEKTTVVFPAFDGNAVEEVATSRFPLRSGLQRITVTSTGGLELDYAILLVYTGLAVGNEPGAMPEGFALHQNFPNPFRTSTTIYYELGEASQVRLTIYDLLGRRVATVVDEFQQAGQHAVRLDSGTLSSGTYLYRLETPAGNMVRRMTVVR